MGSSMDPDGFLKSQSLSSSCCKRKHGK